MYIILLGWKMSGKTKAYGLISDVILRGAKPQEKAYTLRDGNGLFAYVFPNGAIYFQLRYALHGKSKKIQIGTYPKTTLAQARDKAQSIMELVDLEIDPVLEKRKKKAEGQFEVASTYSVIADQWLDLKAKHVTQKYHSKISGMIKANTYSKLGIIPINSINSPMILSTLKVMEMRGAIDLMHRVRALMAELFDYAKVIGVYKSENPVNPLKGSVAFQKHVTEQYKTFRNNKDIGEFLRRLTDYPGKLETQLLIKLQMLVATRPSEMRTATWDEIDFKSNIWTIKSERMKMGNAHEIPLPKQAVVALEQLKALTGHNKYLFPSPTKAGTISEGTANKALKILWPEYLVQPHGFRHLFSTHANEYDHTKADIIEAALSHKNKNKIRATYNKATYLNERRELAQWYADYLDSLKLGVNELRVT